MTWKQLMLSLLIAVAALVAITWGVWIEDLWMTIAGTTLLVISSTRHLEFKLKDLRKEVDMLKQKDSGSKK